LGFWDTHTGRSMGSLSLEDSSPVAGLAFSPDSQCLAVEINNPIFTKLKAAMVNLALKDGEVRVYELASGQPRVILSTPKAALDNRAEKRFALTAEVKSPPLLGSRVAFAPDGKSLAKAGLDRVIRLWDVDTGQELAAFEGHTGKVTAIAFAPDGKQIASASADTTALLWDVYKVQRPRAPAKTLTPSDLAACWRALVQDDAVKAFAAICDLASAPDQTLALIKDKVKPVQSVEMKRIEDLVTQLDDPQYKVRQQARAELFEMGDRIFPVLDRALSAKPSLEARLRMEDLRKQLGDGLLRRGEPLRLGRILEILERMNTAQSRAVLGQLAAGAADARLTQEAKAAWERLNSR